MRNFLTFNTYNTFIIFKYSGHSPISFQAYSLTRKQPTQAPRALIFSTRCHILCSAAWLSQITGLPLRSSKNYYSLKPGQGVRPSDPLLFHQAHQRRIRAVSLGPFDRLRDWLSCQGYSSSCMFWAWQASSINMVSPSMVYAKYHLSVLAI